MHLSVTDLQLSFRVLAVKMQWPFSCFLIQVLQANEAMKCNFVLMKSPVLPQDNPDLFAVMEKTRLLIFHGIESEV